MSEMSESPSDHAGRPEKRTRRKKSKMGVLAADITQGELAKWFHLPAEEACNRLGISLTVLKRVCRKFGIKRWPFRKVKSLGRLIDHISSTLPSGPLGTNTLLPPHSTSGPGSCSLHLPAGASAAAAAAAMQELQSLLLHTPSASPLPSVPGLLSHSRAGQQGGLKLGGSPFSRSGRRHPTPLLPSEASSLDTSAIDMLITAAMESQDRQQQQQELERDEGDGPQSGGDCTGADASSSLIAPAPALGGDDEMEEGEMREAPTQALPEGVPSPALGSSLSPSRQLAQQQHAQRQQQPQQPGGAGPPKEAPAPHLVHPRPTKPVSVKHLVLAKWEQLARQGQQGAADYSSGLCLGRPLSHGSSGDFEDGRQSSGGCMAGSLQKKNSCEMERLPTFGWDATLAAERRQRSQPCTGAATAGASSPAFSFGQQQRQQQQPQQQGVSPALSASLLSRAPSQQRLQHPPQQPWLPHTSLVYAHPPGPGPSQGPSARWGVQEVPTGARLLPRQQLQQPPRELSASKRPMAATGAAASATEAGMQEPLCKRAKHAASVQRVSAEEVDSGPSSGVTLPAAAVGGVPHSRLDVARLMRLLQPQPMHQPQQAAVAAAGMQQPLGAAPPAAQHGPYTGPEAVAICAHVLQAQQAQQAQAMAGMVRHHQQAAQQAVASSELPRRPSSPVSLGSGGGLVGSPGSGGLGAAPIPHTPAQQQLQQREGSGDSAAAAAAAAAYHVQRAQLKEAVRQVAQGRQAVDVPPKLAMYCLQRYAQKLGFVLKGAALQKISMAEEEVAGNNLDDDGQQGQEQPLPQQ